MFILYLLYGGTILVTIYGLIYFIFDFYFIDELQERLNNKTRNYEKD